MKLNEIELWILDTLAEDDYSFVEMRKYVGRNDSSGEDVSGAIINLFCSGFIEVFVKNDGIESILSVNFQKVAIREFLNISEQEGARIAKHFLRLNADGKSQAEELGLQ